MDNLLKKAGAMLPHLELLLHMAALRGLLQLAAHMEERGDRATLVSQQSISLIGAEVLAAPELTTSKGATITAASAYEVLRQLKGHDAPEYAVTREELAALNARAVQDIEGGEALAAFGETLARLGAPDSAPERRTRRSESAAEREPLLTPQAS